MMALLAALGFLFLKTGEKFATPEAAGPTVTEFTTLVGKQVGEATFAPWVGNDPAKAVEYVTTKKPALGIVTPGFYVAYAKALDMEPLLETQRTGVPVERYVLVMRKAAGEGIAAAKGQTIWTTLPAEERYVLGVILESQLGEVRLKMTSDVEGAAFEIGDAAVLMEEATWTALAQDEELGPKLKVVYRSAELPAPLVVAFRANVGRMDTGKVKAALKGLAPAVTGKIRVEKFVDVNEERLKQAEARFHGK
jgi:hypothetical protein